MRRWLEKIWSVLAKIVSFFTRKEGDIVANDSNRDSRNRRVLVIASGELGVTEIPGPGSNSRIDKYYDMIDHDGDSPYTDEVPWCAAFVGAVLKWAGMGHSGSLMARSYEHWGVSSFELKSGWLPGDIVTFYREGKDSGLGHCGFLLKVFPDGRLVVLGGNQNDEVNITIYAPDRMTDIRRSSKSLQHSDAEIAELHAMADNILNERGVGLAGSLS